MMLLGDLPDGFLGFCPADCILLHFWFGFNGMMLSHKSSDHNRK